VFAETTVSHRYIFPVAGGCYPPAQAQEISFMLLRRVTGHVRSRNWTAVGLGFLIILVGWVLTDLVIEPRLRTRWRSSRCCWHSGGSGSRSAWAAATAV
jgi:hypothetical protein